MYATGEEFLARYDARLVGDLVSDTGVNVQSAANNANLLALLEDASGAIDSAVYVGDRYTPLQMANLSDTAAAFCRRLCCDLTLIYLKRRRGRFNKDTDGALQDEVDARLKALRDGEDLLLLQDQTEAPASVVELVRPRLIGVNHATTIRDSTRNYFPFNPDRDIRSQGYGGWR